MVIELRASATPRITRCPGSAVLPQFANTSEPARLGTAVHEACEAIVAGERPDLEQIALTHGVPLEEVKSLYHAAGALWDENGVYFPDPQTEVEFPAYSLEGINHTGSLRGHADIVSYPGDGTVRIADWKSGWNEGEYAAQMKSYALLAWRLAPDPGAIHQVYVAILWLRERVIEGEYYTTEQLEAWEKKLCETIDLAGTGEIRTGDQCRYCPVTDCAAIRSQALALLPVDAFDPALTDPSLTPSPPPTITADNIIQLHHFRKAAEKRLEDIKTLEAQFLRRHGPVETEDGGTLALVAKTRQEIDLNVSAMELLTANFTPAELCEIVKASKTKIVDAVGAKAPHGKKKIEANKFIDSLVKLGAVSETTSFNPGIKKAK